MQIPFEEILNGKIVLVGVGNSLRADDGFGPALIERLRGKTKVVCIDAGNTPENYTGTIIREKPDTVLIADALHLAAAPGEYAILTEEEILTSGFSTHDISAHLFIEYLQKSTQAKIYLLGVQPLSLDFGQQMSAQVKKTLEEIAGLFIQSLAGQ